MNQEQYRPIKINLSRLLGEKRMSQRQLAEIAGLRPNTVNMLYNEKADRIDLNTIAAICKALQCNVGDLLEYVGE